MRPGPGLPVTDGDELDRVLRGYVTRHRARYESQVRAGGCTVAPAVRFCAALDGLLSTLHGVMRAQDARADEVCVAAVGGYGRGWVALHGDIDVLFLHDGTDPQAAGRLAEGFLYPLWDVGLSVGHVVRSIDETVRLAGEDVTTATSVMDVRWLAGSRRLRDRLWEDARGVMGGERSKGFLEALTEGRQERYGRFGDTLYLLEPDVKLSPGGLRDVDLVLWAGKARWGCRHMGDLVTRGALLQREVDALETAHRALWRVRNLLHLKAGRRQDRLTFADQEEVAERLGFEDDLELGVERFMRWYYQQARLVSQTAERMLERAMPRPAFRRRQAVQVAPGILLFDGCVTLSDSAALKENPALCMSLYRQALRHRVPVYPFAVDTVARHAVEARWCAALRCSDDAKRAFVDMVALADPFPGSRWSAVERLHAVGLIGAMVPAFQELVGRVEMDPFYVYTVDVHAVRAVGFAHALVRGDEPDRYPRGCALATEMGRPVVLCLALLMHGVGKPWGARAEERGAALAMDTATALGLSAREAERVRWLVRFGTRFFQWATRRDWGDDDRLASWAQQVESHERLREVYLMSLCVVGSTNPTALGDWHLNLMDELHGLLSRTLEDSDGRRAVPWFDDGALEVERLSGAERAFLAGLPDRYLTSNHPETIREHLSFLTRWSGDDVDMRFVKANPDGGPHAEVDDLELVVCAPDQPGLLAQLAAVFAQRGFNVRSAQVYTWRRSTSRGEGQAAFDVFHLTRSGPLAPQRPVPDLKPLMDTLRALSRAEVSSAELVNGITRPPSWVNASLPPAKSKVVVDNSVSSNFTVVDVFARDRLGLLYVVADVFQRLGLTVFISKVATIDGPSPASRVCDVFYIQDAHHHKVVEAERIAELQERLIQAIDAYEETW